MSIIFRRKIIRQSGFSLLEILIALVIIGILSVIAINRYTERSEEARIAAAKSEMHQMAKAQQQVEIDTGFYVTLRALDAAPGIGVFFENGIEQYRIQSEPIPFAIDTDGSFFLGPGQFPYDNWKGPYITYQSMDSTGDPKDPWGNRYRLFTEIILTNPTEDDTGFQVYLPFDRMRIVSYGKNGIPDRVDDIEYRF